MPLPLATYVNRDKSSDFVAKIIFILTQYRNDNEMKNRNNQCMHVMTSKLSNTLSKVLHKFFLRST